MVGHKSNSPQVVFNVHQSHRLIAHTPVFFTELGTTRIYVECSTAGPGHISHYGAMLVGQSAIHVLTRLMIAELQWSSVRCLHLAMCLHIRKQIADHWATALWGDKKLDLTVERPNGILENPWSLDDLALNVVYVTLFHGELYIPLHHIKRGKSHASVGGL